MLRVLKEFIYLGDHLTEDKHKFWVIIIGEVPILIILSFCNICQLYWFYVTSIRDVDPNDIGTSAVLYTM